MKFRLRRQKPAVSQPVSPPLSQDQLFAVVHEKLAQFVGSEGAWVVTRRSHDDRDPIFHGMLARSLAHELSAAIQEEQERAGNAAPAEASPITAAIPVMRASTEPITVPAPSVQAESTVATEPAALSWTPQPIAVWADPAADSIAPADAPPVAVDSVEQASDVVSTTTH
ncbi:hypothetical protein HQQ81_05555 [Microbacteriaceae bacterium VKM Ac-2854]|nr:hypothetical protein [Microbacteriaceae bacterium VKM Ac-2854]